VKTVLGAAVAAVLVLVGCSGGGGGGSGSGGGAQTSIASEVPSAMSVSIPESDSIATYDLSNFTVTVPTLTGALTATLTGADAAPFRIDIASPGPPTPTDAGTWTSISRRSAS